MVVFLNTCAVETRLLVDVPCGDEFGLRPERDLAIADRAGEVDALLDKAASEPEAARGGLDEEETQLATASVWRTRNTEPTMAPSFSAIQQRSRAASKVRMNFAAISATRLRSARPSRTPGSGDAVAMDDPADVGRCERRL